MLVCLRRINFDSHTDNQQEIMTGTVPYVEYRTDAGVCGAIFKRQFPRRPKEFSGSGARETNMWTLLEQCWDYDPESRPDASSVLGYVSL